MTLDLLAGSSLSTFCGEVVVTGSEIIEGSKMESF
jgi:hypothetical protein